MDREMVAKELLKLAKELAAEPNQSRTAGLYLEDINWECAC